MEEKEGGGGGLERFWEGMSFGREGSERLYRE